MTRLSRDDRGQITTALVMVGIVMLVALGLLVTKLGQAADQKSKVQIAADAAALAGAQQIRMEAPGRILSAIGSGHGGNPFPGNGCIGVGQDAAKDFADRAGAAVTEYCYTPSTDTVQVYVKNRDWDVSVSAAPARAQAEARVGWPLGACDTLVPLTPIPPLPSTTSPPTDSPTTTPTPVPTTTPASDVQRTVNCGKLPVEIVLDGASGEITHLPSPSDIFDMFTPALKS